MNAKMIIDTTLIDRRRYMNMHIVQSVYPKIITNKFVGGSAAVQHTGSVHAPTLSSYF